MKYLQVFEGHSNSISTSENIKRYFENKVDWTFIKYLESKLTKYEDMGFNCIIKVSVKMPNTYYISIYEYHLNNNKSKYIDFSYSENDIFYKMKTMIHFY